MKCKKNLILILLITIAISCEKEKDLSKTEILTQKPWKLTSWTVSPPLDYPDIGLISDFFALYSDCAKDDIWVLKSTGSYTWEEGETKCNVSDPAVYDMGTWTFNSDETVLTTSSNLSGLNSYDIVELTTSAMKLRYQRIDTLDNIYTFNEGYGH